MGSPSIKTAQNKELFLDPQEFFSEAVTEAFEKRKVDTYPLVKTYIVNLLSHYMFTENLFDCEDESGRKNRPTLAELFLEATNASQNVRRELLKKLGDSALYVSGFFGESLQRKLVDVDYYVNMGCTAYDGLASSTPEDTFTKLYKEMSCKFVDFMDVLTYISEKSMASSESNIMHLYLKFATTGSQAAMEKLLEQGINPVPLDEVAQKKQ